MSPLTRFATNDLQDSPIGIRHKLSALWASATLCYLYGDYFDLYVPGTVNGLASGDNNLDSPTTLLAAAASLLVPALMVALSLVLSPRVSRLVNIVGGVLFTVFVALVAVSSLDGWHTFYVLYSVVEVCLTLSIAWLAWRWPRAATSRGVGLAGDAHVAPPA